MDSTILQVPISKNLRDEAAAVASGMGFSSKISFENPSVQLSGKAVKRYNKISEDFELNRDEYPSFTGVDKMMKYLRK